MNAGKIFLLITCVLLSFPAGAAEKPSVEGKYDLVQGREFSFDGTQVEIVEFLSFYCSHCYQFEKEIPAVRGNFPGKIKWKTVPIYWGSGSPKPGEAYFLAEEAGKGEEMKDALFRAFFVEKRNIGSTEVLESIGTKVGLGFDFSRRLRAGDKAKEVGEALLMARKYHIDETPTLVIAGNIRTNPGMVSDMRAFRNNVITILRGIFKK